MDVVLGKDDPRTHAHLGWAFQAKGQLADAIASYQEAIGVKNDYPLAHNNLAWLLVTSSDLKLRDPKAALVSAKIAVEQEKTSGDYWNTLGVAYYRNGEWQLAVDSLSQAIKLREEQHANSEDGLFFLAMAYWQLRDKDQARACYEKAVQWMTGNELRPELVAELERWRTEAGELLGIDVPKQKTADAPAPKK